MGSSCDSRSERDRSETEVVAGDRYSYRELDDFTDLISRTIQGAPEVAKIERKGVLPEQIFLGYSQQRLAEYGVRPADLKNILGARNATLSGGALDVGPQNILIDPSGKFTSEQQIGQVIIGTSATASHSPVYLRDLVDISRGYQSPPRYLNYFTWQAPDGRWHRSRAVTVAVQMKDGEQINAFGRSVDQKLLALRQYLPSDLIIARTSDQPLQVEENINLFMEALY
jgi:multidrug efflux pump subunit AcrB